MGDPAYPWKKNWTESFPRHTEFREYIQYYYDGVLGSKGKACFRFGQRVEEVRRENTAAGKKYRIRTSATEGLFDHVLIASGHFDVPYIPPPFADTLKKSIGEVNQLQKTADVKMQQLATGENKNIADVMVATEKADIALKLMVQVRNKVINAYNEIMKMQV